MISRPRLEGGTRPGLVLARLATVREIACRNAGRHGIDDHGLERIQRPLLILFAESLKIGLAVRIE